MEGILRAWRRILAGRTPLLSIEITRECPLRCPGCYAYGTDHLSDGPLLREVSDFQGQSLIDRVTQLVERYKPLHVSFVGGEPLVRFRELNALLPRLTAMGIHCQIVTSAVRPIPAEWASIPRLQICVSIDGLQPEHDLRRKPATYERILRHIAGHQTVVHCTVTRQQSERNGYLEEFVRFWSGQNTTKRIWMSLYTPQMGEQSEERLSPHSRERVIAELRRLIPLYPKLEMNDPMLDVYLNPPHSPKECIFSKITASLTADLQRQITPCQFGGNPDCSNCGCIASAGFAAIARHKLPVGFPVQKLFDASFAVGNAVRQIRKR